jgi:hypothetical protein
MIKHFLGHKFIERTNSPYFIICIECNSIAYYNDDFTKIYTIELVNGGVIQAILNISCDEVIIKKLLE